VVLLAPGESCEIAATALVRVRLDRDPGSGSMRASALALDERDAGTVVQRCTRDLEHAKSLLRQIDTLRRAIIESKLDATQLEALRAAWLLLSPDERSQVAPGSADDPPRTADAMRMIHGMAEQHLRARRDELQRALGELRVRRSEFPKLLFRVSTLDGAVVAERPIGLGASPR
jgi:hypothetical protein